MQRQNTMLAQVLRKFGYDQDLHLHPDIVLRSVNFAHTPDQVRLQGLV